MTAGLIPTPILITRPRLASEPGLVQLRMEPGYEALRDVVEPIIGARMEHVTILLSFGRGDMFVDEIGGQKGLDRNEEATRFYRRAHMLRYPDVNPELLACIYGPAVVFPTRRVWW